MLNRFSRLLCLSVFALLSAALHAADANAPIDVAAFPGKIVLACVGDSITAGSGAKKGESYPQQLAKLLGDKWDVKNFGVSGATLLKNGDKSYQKQGAFKQALESKANVVLIMLGTNDTKPQNWSKKTEFVADYKDLIGQFAKLETKPRIFICRPVPVPGKGNYGINEEALKEQIPIIDDIAKSENVGLIDMHAALEGKDALLPDRVHPNSEGAGEMAKTAAKALTGK